MEIYKSVFQVLYTGFCRRKNGCFTTLEGATSFLYVMNVINPFKRLCYGQIFAGFLAPDELVESWKKLNATNESPWFLAFMANGPNSREL